MIKPAEEEKRNYYLIMGRGSRQSGIPTLRADGLVPDPADADWLRAEEIEHPEQLGNILCEKAALEELRSRGIEPDEILALLPETGGMESEGTLLHFGPGKIHLRARIIGGASMVRTLDFEAGVAHQNSFELSEALRGAGLGAETFERHLRFYQKTGIERVELFANSEMGGYFWARLGFRPPRGGGAAVRRQLGRGRDQIAELRMLLETTNNPALEETISDLRLNEQFLEENISDLDIQSVAAFRPRVRLSKEAEEIVSEIPDASKIFELDGSDDSPFSGKTLLRSGGWAGELHLGDEEQMAICRDYLRQRRHAITAR